MRHSVFTIEVCARFDVGPQLLDALRPLVQTAPENVTRDEAWRRHVEAANLLLQHVDVIERGCWEYFDDEARAKWMFDDWTRPVLERDIPRQEASGEPGYRDSGPRYLTFTMVYLLARDSPSDLGAAAALPDPRLGPLAEGHVPPLAPGGAHPQLRQRAGGRDVPHPPRRRLGVHAAGPGVGDVRLPATADGDVKRRQAMVSVVSRIAASALAVVSLAACGVGQAAPKDATPTATVSPTGKDWPRRRRDAEQRGIGRGGAEAQREGLAAEAQRRRAESFFKPSFLRVSAALRPISLSPSPRAGPPRLRASAANPSPLAECCAIDGA